MRSLSIFILTLFVSLPVHSETKIYVPLIDGLFTHDRTGTYDLIFERIKSDGMFDWDLEYVPFARAVRQFEVDPESCISIGNAQAAQDYYGIAGAFDIGLGFSDVSMVYATLSDRPIINNLSELKGLEIVHLIGESPIQYSIDTDANYTPVRSHNVSLRMLQAGRAQAVFGASSDFLPFEDDLHWSSSFSVFSTYETLTCKDTEKNRAMLSRFKSSLERVMKVQ